MFFVYYTPAYRKYFVILCVINKASSAKRKSTRMGASLGDSEPMRCASPVRFFAFFSQRLFIFSHSEKIKGFFADSFGVSKQKSTPNGCFSVLLGHRGLEPRTDRL